MKIAWFWIGFDCSLQVIRIDNWCLWRCSCCSIICCLGWEIQIRDRGMSRENQLYQSYKLEAICWYFEGRRGEWIWIKRNASIYMSWKNKGMQRSTMQFFSLLKPWGQGIRCFVWERLSLSLILVKEHVFCIVNSLTIFFMVSLQSSNWCVAQNK